MDQPRNTRGSHGRVEREQFQNSLDMLHKTIGRLHAMGPEYRDVIEHAQLNVREACALEKEINSFATHLGLLPLTGKTIEWRAIQRRRSSIPGRGVAQEKA